MGASSSVHFRGKFNVIQAYVDRGVEAWSIWQGKQFLTKGMDEQALNAFLEMLTSSESVAIYTVRVYEDVTDLKKIKSTTADDGSFNFRLRDPENYAGGSPGFSVSQGWQEMTRRLDGMEAQWSAFLDKFGDDAGEDEGDGPEGIMGAITGLLQNPERLEKLVNVGKSLLGLNAQPAYIGNVNRLEGSAPGPAAQPVDAEAKLRRLGAAIDTLERHDPQLVEHLEKLANLSSGQPKTFSTLINMLDAF